MKIEILSFNNSNMESCAEFDKRVGIDRGVVQGGLS